MSRAPTIYEALRDKLGREPSHREQCNEVRRILGQLPPDYEARVQAYEAQGICRSDAQGIVDAEELRRWRS